MASDFLVTDRARLIHGHVMDGLRVIGTESVNCIVTSPPYWGLRSYSTEPQVWGGNSGHEHVWDMLVRKQQTGGTGAASAKQVTNTGSQDAQLPIVSGSCTCGAWRGELGAEPLISMFVDHLVSVFRECRRVMRDDGVLFVNLGDSYAGSGRGPSSKNGLTKQHSNTGPLVSGPIKTHEAKPKDLCLIPERFALAMQDDGWYVRSRIAWCKRAPMPESVQDRPTSAWEHIWMFAKSRSYYWDQDAVRPDTGRNLWNYWVLGPDPSPDAHFATFPRALARTCIRAASPRGGMVLDPFAGSGRAGEVAVSEGRMFTGIELSEAYCQIAAKKLGGAVG